MVVSSGSLADLARLEPDQLMAIYRSARTPTLEELDGKFSGRVLRMQNPQAHRFLQRVLGSRLLPWHKTFAHETAGHGYGRMLFWFKFETSIGRSRVGDFDAVHISYRHPIMRSERDEVREVGTGLCLGLWYMRGRGGDKLIGFFGLARQPRREVLEDAPLEVELKQPFPRVLGFRGAKRSPSADQFSGCAGFG